VQGASQAQEVRNRKASPEGPGKKQRRKPKFQERSRKAPEGWRARKSTIRNGIPEGLKRGASQGSTSYRDAEAGLRCRFQSGVRRKPNAGGNRREGGFARAHSPSGSRARGSTGRRELAAARGEGRKARAICGGTSLRPMPEGWGKGRKSWKPARGPDGAAGVSQQQRKVKGMPEGRFTTKAQRREPQRRREAGQKAGRMEWQETKGVSPASSAGAGRRQEG